MPGFLFAPSGEGPHDPDHDIFVFWRHEFVFSYSSCSGGAYESVATAAAIGGVLFLAAAFLGWRLRRGRAWMPLFYAAVYVLALVVLWNALAPRIWGDPLCLIG